MQLNKTDAAYAVVQTLRFANNFRLALILGETGALTLAVYALLKTEGQIGIWAGMVVASSLLVHAALEVWNYRRSRKATRYIFDRDFLLRAFEEAAGRGILFFAHQNGRMLVIQPPPVFCAHGGQHNDDFETFEKRGWRAMRQGMIGLEGLAAIQSTKRGALTISRGEPGEAGHLWRWNSLRCMAEVYQHNEDSVLPPGYYITDLDNPRWTYYPLAGSSRSADVLAMLLRVSGYDLRATIDALKTMDSGNGEPKKIEHNT